MAVPIRHKACGHILFWYIGCAPYFGMLARSRDLITADGDPVVPMSSTVTPTCPGCGWRVRGIPDMTKPYDAHNFHPR